MNSTHWANIFTSIGTVGAAVAAAGGLLTAIRLARQDRTDADARLAAERRYSREQSAKQFQAQLLLKAGELYTLLNSSDSTQATNANRQLRSVLHALPETTCTLMRRYLGMNKGAGTPGDVRRPEVVREIGGVDSVDTGQPSAEWVYIELGRNIEEATNP